MPQNPYPTHFNIVTAIKNTVSYEHPSSSLPHLRGSGAKELEARDGHCKTGVQWARSRYQGCEMATFPSTFAAASLARSRRRFSVYEVLPGGPPMFSRISSISMPPTSGPMAVELISAPHWSRSGSSGSASQSWSLPAVPQLVPWCAHCDQVPLPLVLPLVLPFALGLVEELAPLALGCWNDEKPGGGMMDILFEFGSYGSADIPHRLCATGVVRPEVERPNPGDPETPVPVPFWECGNAPLLLPRNELARGFSGAGGGMSGAWTGDLEPARLMEVDP